MKRFYMLLNLLVAITSIAAAQKANDAGFDYKSWQGTPAEWHVEAKLETTDYEVGKAVPLRLTMRNVSVSAKRLVSVYPFADYMIEIKDADNNSVSYTELAVKLRSLPQMYSACCPRIEAGAIWESTLDLSKYFQLTKPGKYTVFIRRYYSFREMFSGGKDGSKEKSSKAKPVVFTLTL